MGKKGGQPQAAPPSALANDARFAAALTDARFQRFPKKRHTVAIDDRFKGGAGSPRSASRRLLHLCMGVHRSHAGQQQQVRGRCARPARLPP
jgi:hypothetical protein